MKRINIYIGEDQHKKLKSKVKRLGRSGYSEFIRTAIDDYLQKSIGEKKKVTASDNNKS